MSALQRLKEPSTIRGLIALVGLVGWQFNLAQEEQIIAAVASIIALVEVFRKESA